MQCLRLGIDLFAQHPVKLRLTTINNHNSIEIIPTLSEGGVEKSQVADTRRRGDHTLQARDKCQRSLDGGFALVIEMVQHYGAATAPVSIDLSRP